MILYFLTIITLSAAAPDRRVTQSRVTDSWLNQYDPVCKNSDCVDTASYILQNMDASIDPCENFYQFSCGQFVEKTVIPDNEVQVSVFSQTAGKLQEQLLLSMSEKIENNDIPIVKMIKTHYQACMNIDQIEKNSKNELLEVLNNIGGCPVLDGTSWDEKNYDWKKSVDKANQMGYSSDIFLTTRVGVDPANSSRHIVIIDQAATELPRELLLSGTTDAVQVLFDMMMNITKLFGGDEERAKQEIVDSLQFEMYLARISLSDEDRRNQTKLNNRIALDQLETRYTFVPWTEYINEILTPYAKVNSSEEVIVTVPSFLEELSKLLAKTPKRVLANYACMRTVFKSIGNMGQDMLKIEATARETLSGITQQLPRSKICAKSVSDHLATAVGWLYASRYFDTDVKTLATDLTKNLRNTLHGLIKQANWMDDNTKYEALKKLESITSHVAYPDEFDNVEMVNAYYESVTPHPESFLKSELEMERFSKMIQYSSLRKSVNATDWVDFSSAAQANALYYVSVNSFDLPAGMLQGHFFNKVRPNYMNYAAIGSIIGHELSHAFDDEGSQYDKNGILTDWWKNATKQEYLNRAKCIVDQYSSYTLEEAANTTLNGIITLGENIADNIGLKAAYFAYDEWTKKHGKESRLQGLDYTPKQMFWISYANNWCTKTVPEVLPYMLLTNKHALGEFRVIGTVSNMHEFSKDFNCPLESPMNPVKKCALW